MEKQWAKLVFENAGDFEEVSEFLLRFFETTDVGDLLRGFEAEDESGGNLFKPAFEQFLFRHAIKGVVDFDGVEALGIEAKHLGGFDIERKEFTLPFFVTEAAGADVKVHGFGRN